MSLIVLQGIPPDNANAERWASGAAGRRGEAFRAWSSSLGTKIVGRHVFSYTATNQFVLCRTQSIC